MTEENPKDAGRFSMEWASDAIAELLRRLGFKYIALNPGASFRGLHDSIVNYLGNESPRILLTLHEEHAVSIAHGYAKVTGEPMAVVVHSNVGLMHATMPIFNAWCDRVPVMVLGATGPVDADLRRPWIDWIHTSKDQGALVRDYTKWDDQPASVPAALESLLRANLLCRTAPCGPVYVCFDMALQENRLEGDPSFPDVSRFMPAPPQHPSQASLKQAAELLSRADRPLILIGRTSRSRSGWDDRVLLAESLGARVLTDLKAGAGFPTSHPLNAVASGEFLLPDGAALIKDS
ncbi:MAG: thiamine pyrophosphate-binding protein, partial [Pseudomonadota bacterium]